MRNLSLSQKGMILIFMTLVFQVFFMCVLGYLLNLTGKYVEQERAAREIIFQINRLSGLMDNASIGFAEQIQREDPPTSQSFHDTYGRFLELIPRQLEVLKSLTADSPNSRDVDQLCQSVSDGSVTLELCRKACIQNIPERFVLAAKLKKTSRHATHQADELVNKYRDAQEVEMREQTTAKNEVVAAIVIGTALDLAIAVILVATFTNSIGKRIEMLHTNAERIASGVPLLKPQDTDDELGLLDRALFQAAQDLAEAQRKEQVIINNAVDLICSIDSRGTFVDVNPGSFSLIGFAPDELLGKRFIDLVSEEQKSNSLEFFKSAQKSSEPLQFENILVHKSGREVHAAWSVHWSQAESTLFCVVHNISQRKEVERLKQEFVAMVSHDLKTPLGTVQMTMELLEMGAYGELSADGICRIKSVNNEVSRLIALVNGLLSLEKLESGEFNLELRSINAGQLIEPSLHAVYGAASHAEIEIKVDNPDDPIVKGDQDRLTQVMVNFLSNAIKFSPVKSKIVVSVTKAPSSVRFEFADEGRGVEEQKRNTIFERFSQANKTDETEKGGSGLGLSICKTIIEKHGGRLGVNPNHEKGSIFWFELPD